MKSTRETEISPVQMQGDEPARLRVPPLDSKENRLFYLAVAAGCFFVLLLALPMFRGRVYEFDDLNNYHLPFRYFYAKCLAAGDSFIWNPSVFCGFYLHGEGQAGMYHPLHMLLYKALPLAVAYDLELILSYPFMMAGMFFFLRRWKIPRDASMLGALIFAFSGFNIMHYAHISAVAVGAHLPWTLMTIDVIVRDSGRRKRAFAVLGLALLTASQLLLGNPLIFWYSSLTELLYALILIAPWKHLRQYLVLGTAKMIGILIGAVQLLPHWEMASGSVRDKPALDFLMWPSVHPIQLLQIVAPYFFNSFAFDGIGYGLKAYNGAIPLALLIVLIIRIKELGRWKRLAVAILAFNLISLIMATGRYGHLYRLQTFLPLVGLLREPCRYILLFHLTMSVGAAIAFADISRLIRHNSRLKFRSMLPLLLVPAASIAPFFLMTAAKSGAHPLLAKYFIHGMSSQTNMIVAGPALFILSTLLIVLALRGKDYALLGIVVLVIIDLFFYGATFIGRDGSRNIKTIVNSFPAPGSNPEGYRVQSDDIILTMKGLNLAGGYAGLPPKKELDSLNPNRLKVAGAHWILAKNTLRFGGRSYGITLPKPLPRVRLVTKAVVSKAPGEDIDGIDIASTALVSQNLELPDGPAGSASLVVDKPGEIKVAAECESKQLLVLSESYHEGWKATIDGKPARVVRVCGDFMGCVIDAGKHVVEFNFRPKSLAVGKWLSLLGIILSLVTFPFFLRKKGSPI